MYVLLVSSQRSRAFKKFIQTIISYMQLFVYTGTYDIPDDMPYAEVGYIVLVTLDQTCCNYLPKVIITIPITSWKQM